MNNAQTLKRRLFILHRRMAFKQVLPTARLDLTLKPGLKAGKSLGCKVGVVVNPMIQGQDLIVMNKGDSPLLYK